ncbi:hypothetical protein [Helicobacter macacae]|nr:hypothetical protein [Helicobacter macacae]
MNSHYFAIFTIAESCNDKWRVNPQARFQAISRFCKRSQNAKST